MLTTAGRTLATAITPGSEAGSAWARHDVDVARATSAPASTRMAFLGSARVSRASASPARTEHVLAIANFSRAWKSLGMFGVWKDCFGATPKPARETHALPRFLDATLIVARRFA